MSDEPLEIVIKLNCRDGRFDAARRLSTRTAARTVPALRLAADSPLEIHGQSHTLGEPLDALLARRPGVKPPNFERFFDERGQQDLGAYLYGELFRDLSPVEERDLDAAGQVDLVIVTDDPYLARIPWVLLVRQHHFLAAGRWTITLAHSDDRLDRRIDLPHASQLLIAAPNPRTDEYPDTEAEEHVEELEAALRTYRPQLVRGQHLRVVASWPQLRQTLTAQAPDVLYYYGHADANRQLARLIFPDAETGVRAVPVADLAACLARLPQPPSIVYLNCCHGDAGGVLGAGGQLACLVPAVVSNRTMAFVRCARLQARRFLEQTLLFGAAPHEAVRELYGLGDEDEFTFSDPRWMTPVCYRGYGRWHAPAVDRGEGVRDPHWREKLDREYQFGIVFDKTHRMLIGGTPRGYSFVWYGRQGQGMEAFHHRLNVELRDRLPRDMRLVEYRLHWPDELGTDDPAFDPDQSFREMYEHGVGVGDWRDIARKIKLDASGAQKALVYFRHRVITNPQVFNRRFLKAYLLWWDLNLPRLLGPGQYGLLGVSYQSQDPDKFRRIVTEELKLELLEYQNTVCRVLVRFTDIDESHLNEFIQMVGFPLPAEGRAEILQEICQQSERMYEAIIRELEIWLRRGFRRMLQAKPALELEGEDLL